MAAHQIHKQLKAWACGDDRAFRSLFDHFYPRLLAASLRVIKNREDAEELVMNSLLKIWQHQHKISDIKQFDDYLFGIMRQQIAGFMRKKMIVTQNIDEVPPMQLGVTSAGKPLGFSLE